MYNAAKPRVVAIGGPTATGKTAFSVALAKRFGGEIISADSMQIYQGLDVGTAKVTPEEMQGVPHHLVGFLAPEQAFSVADFTTLAGKTITQLTAQGKLPLVVGGTGLYITSLLNGIGFTPEKVDPAIRQELQARLQAEGSQALYAELAAVDPGYAAKVHPNNTPGHPCFGTVPCHRPQDERRARGRPSGGKTLPFTLSLPDLPRPHPSLPAD